MADADAVTPGAVQAGTWRRTYEVQAPITDVVAFYESELPSAGWKADEPATTTPEGTEATWRRPGLLLDVSIANSAAGTDPSTAPDATGTSTVNLSLSRSGGS